MNILSVGIKCDLLALIYELSEGKDIVINQFDNGKNALIHLGETTLSYDWIIIDHRESERYSERWDKALASLSNCKVILIPREYGLHGECGADHSNPVEETVVEENDFLQPDPVKSREVAAMVYELGAPRKKQA